MATTFNADNTQEQPPGPEDRSDELAKLLGNLLIARRDVKAVQHSDGSYHPDRTPWRREDIKAHISGKRTLGHYVVKQAGDAKLFAFDLDLTTEGVWLPDDAEPGEYVAIKPRDEWLHGKNPAIKEWLTLKLRTLADSLAGCIEKMGIPSAVTCSGSKGLHVLAFSGLGPANEQRALAHAVLKKLGGFEPTRGDNFFRHESDGNTGFPLTVEVFPKQDSIAADGLGSLLRMELGINRKSGQRGFFVDTNAPYIELRPIDPMIALPAVSAAWDGPEIWDVDPVNTDASDAEPAGSPPCPDDDDAPAVSNATPRRDTFQERLARLGQVAEPEPVEKLGYVGDDPLPIPRSSVSGEVGEIKAEVKRRGVVTAFDRWSGKGPAVITKVEGNMVSCPNPEHPDEHPSAWINTDLDVGDCATCGGFDAIQIASWHFGFGKPCPPALFPALMRKIADDIGFIPPSRSGLTVVPPIGAQPAVAPGPSVLRPAVPNVAGVGVGAPEQTAPVRGPVIDAEANREQSPYAAVRFIRGDDFMDRANEAQSTLWGEGEKSLWPPGQPLFVVAPPGLGKSTVSERLILARLQIGSGLVLGLPVTPDDRCVLLLGFDRPLQQAGSLDRMVRDPADRKRLGDRLKVLTFNEVEVRVQENPRILLDLAGAAGAGLIVIDSLKDIILKPSDEEQGGALNRAVQLALANGVEVILNHHVRKNGGGAVSIDDVYGSMFFAAGAGSLLMLSGKPGGEIKLTQVKAPKGEYAEISFTIEPTTGALTVVRGNRAVSDDDTRIQAFAERSFDAGVTAAEVAKFMAWPDGTKGERDASNRKAERVLERLTTKGRLMKADGRRGGTGGGQASRWFGDDGWDSYIGDKAVAAVTP